MDGAFDLVIRGGRVVDGTGRPPFPADVAVRDGRIVAVEALPDAVDTVEVVAAEGLLVAPGFVDIHTHSDLTVIADPAAESKLLQGVTTDVTGNCGFSPFPTADAHRHDHTELMAMLGPTPPVAGWPDLDAYASALRADPPAINIAPLVGHGALRVDVVGTRAGPLSDDELATIVARLETALEQGAFGLSTGLTYVPSMYATAAELAAIAAVLARRGRLYATHARYTAGCGMGSMEELIALSRATGVRAQLSHIALIEPSTWGRAGDACALFDAAVTDGHDVAFDLYPYDASSSNLTQYLPEWVARDGVEAMRRRLTDPDVRARAVVDVAAGWFGGIPWNWEGVRVSRAPDPALVGHTIAALAADRGSEPAAVMVDLCLAHGNELQVVLASRRADDVATFLAHPLATLGSDGSALPLDIGADAPHPRSYGAHARLLGHYAVHLAILSVEAAVAKMTSAPARRIGLADRGEVAPGMAADLVVFDGSTVRDQATFERPAQPPTGVRHVIVNGARAVVDGKLTGVHAGQVLSATSR